MARRAAGHRHRGAHPAGNDQRRPRPSGRAGDRRALARIGKPDEAPTVGHHREWLAEEIPFNTAQRTWERADLIVCGTPQIPCDPTTDIVIAPPFPPAR